LFRNSSGSAADLLRELDVQLPEYDEVRPESSDLNNLQPAEYRADLVLFLVRGSHKVLGVIVEVQLGYDEDKPYAWPAYIANLRARHRCPVCLLVITIEDALRPLVAEVFTRSRAECGQLNELVVSTRLGRSPYPIPVIQNGRTTAPILSSYRASRTCQPPAVSERDQRLWSTIASLRPSVAGFRKYRTRADK
jgi:hypothetical protein